MTATLAASEEPATGNLVAFLFARADRAAVALRCPAGALTYGALEAETARAAAALAARNVTAGDRVMVVAQKSLPVLTLMLGAWRLGAVFVPLGAGSPADMVGEVAGRVRRRLNIADPGRTGLAGPVESLDAEDPFWADAPADGQAEPLRPDAPALLIHTSGTTGPRKAAVLTHGNLLHQAQALAAVWDITARDTLIHALPLDHAHGLFVATLPLLWAGGTIDLHPRFDPGAVVAAMGAATVFMGVPFHYARLLAAPEFGAAAAAGMRLFVCGSAPLPAVLREDFLARTGHAIVNRYGMSECGVLTAQSPAERGAPGCVGRPLPRVAVRVVARDTGTPVAGGESGAVEVSGPNVFPGYWDDPGATAASFRPDGWFRTGDEGRLDADGRLTLVGRTKEIIIYCGINIHPLEVETALRDVAGVADAAVFGVPHPDCGEAVFAAVTARDGAVLVPHAVRAALIGRLAEHAVPRRVVVLDELPRTAVGKVAKAELAARFAGTFAAGG